MPTNTSLVINSIDSNNKKISDTINYVNPNISNSVALQLAQRVNNLTNNSYQSTTRVNKEELDEQKTTFTIAEARINNSVTAQITNGVCNATLPLSSITNDSFTIALFSTKGVPAMNRFPLWQSDSSQMVSFQWGGPNAASGSVNRIIPNIKLNAAEAQTVQGTFTMLESATTAEYTITFNITITGEG